MEKIWAAMGAVPAWSATRVPLPNFPEFGQPPLLFSLSPCLLVFKREPTHPPLGHANQRGAEGGGVDARADGEAGPPLLDLAGGHGVPVDRKSCSRPGPESPAA